MSALRKEDARIDELPVRQQFSIVEYDDSPPEFLDREVERWNYKTHAAGFVASFTATAFLVKVATVVGSVWEIAGCLIYAATMNAVYLCSTLSHGEFGPVWRHRFRTLDQVSIFLFISGSFTPYAITFLRTPVGWSLLAASWSLAITGSALKIFVTRDKMVPVWFYVLMGWFPAITLLKIAFIVPLAATQCIVAGGLAYTVGTYFLVFDHRARWYHPTWHLLVIVGTGCHFAAILISLLHLA